MQVKANIFKALGLQVPARFVGGTITGPPLIGTFNANDYCVDGAGTTWVCTAAGTPGTWVANAPSSNLLAPLAMGNGVLASSTIAPGNLVALTCRVVVQKSGILHDVSTFITTSAAAHTLLAVYDTGDALAGSRSLLASNGGTVATGGAPGWQTWDPALAVKAGQHLDFLVAFDSATPAIARFGVTSAGSLSLPTTKFLPVPGGASPKLAGTITLGSLVAPATIAEASLLTSSISLPLLVGAVT